MRDRNRVDFCESSSKQRNRGSRDLAILRSQARLPLARRRPLPSPAAAGKAIEDERKLDLPVCEKLSLRTER
jgi:hypothetical protein